MIQKIIIVLIGGIFMGLTTAPWGIWPLGWVAFAPLWLSLIKRQENHHLSWLFPLVWGIGYYGLALSWMVGMHPMTFLGISWLQSLVIALVCWVAVTVFGLILVLIWAYLFSLVSNLINRRELTIINSLIRVIIGTALWCGLELLFSQTDLWWPAISYTQSPHNLVILHLGRISGPNTVAAAIISVNGLIAEAFLFKGKSRLILGNFSLILCLTLHLIGTIFYQQPLNFTPDQALKLGIIQGNIPNKIKYESLGWQRALEGYTKGYEFLADQGVDGVLIPETALPFIWHPENQRNLSFYQAILAKGVPAWVGAFGEYNHKLTNSLFSINSRGENVSRYDKIKLVPLGEYVPFEEILGKIISKLSVLDAHLVKGKPGQIFDTPFGRAIVGICYDSAFAENFRSQAKTGGLFMLISSNNAHYAPSMGFQHYAQDVMRAIEIDRWAVRATNTGYSGVLDPHGHTIWLSQFNQYQLHIDTIYRRATQTLYVRWGDWLTPSLLTLSLLLLLYLKVSDTK